MSESYGSESPAVWVLKWVDNSGKQQSATTGSKDQIDQIMESLELSGISGFTVHIL